MKKITFDPAKGRLWINIEMLGIYFITYAYQMWSAIASEPPILSNPLRKGNNDSPHDDHFEVINDFNTTDPLANFDKRCLDVNFWVKKIETNDNGYILKLNLLQGNDFESATLLDNIVVTGTLGTLNLKEEGAVIQLIKK
ncbi:MAG: hypothetical protein Q8T03_02750 [Bacteroidota bacterium]|nr:hypothetical protein [Bacteroidota bacterium]